MFVFGTRLKYFKMFLKIFFKNKIVKAIFECSLGIVVQLDRKNSEMKI